MKQSNVITAQSGKHTVEPYRFKVLSSFADRPLGGDVGVTNDRYIQPDALGADFQPGTAHLNYSNSNLNQADEEPALDISNSNKQDAESETVSNLTEQTPDETAMQPSSPSGTPIGEPSFIEELLKRTDELSDNIVKLQMKIESQETEFKARLEEETAKAREAALAEGAAQARAEFEEKLKQIEAKFANSIAKIDEEKAKLEAFYAKNEQELAAAAMQIAKEVVIRETSENSSKVALAIAKNLVGELENATNIEVKVSESDLDYLKENLKLSSNLKLSADDAVAPGGAIIMSDVGNIDGNIMTRFEKIKKILSE